MAMVLSIEIDDKNIKIIEASKKGEILSVSRCMSMDVGYGVKDGKITDMGRIANLISEEFKKNGIKAKKAVFVINSSSIMIRTIKLPLLKKGSEILSMIQIELQQTMSADLNKYKILFEISEVINESKISYAVYIVYCVPVILVNQYIELAENLKLKLVKIDILPGCINALYKNNIKVNDAIISINNTAAFVCIKENIITFSVIKNGYCDFYIISELKKNYIERAAESQSMYMYSDNYSTVDKEIVLNLAKFIRNYYSVSSNKSIDKIYTYGNCTQEINKAIKSKLNIDSETIDSISNIAMDEKLSNNFELNKYLSTVLTLFTHNKEIMLCPTKNRKFRNNYGYAAILVVIIAAVVSLFGFINSQVAMRNKISAMSLYVNNKGNNENNNKIENIKKETAYLERYLKLAENLQKAIKNNDYVDSDILRKINKSKPSKTKVTSIYSDKDSTQLQCVSPSMIEATLFFSNLRKIEKIESAYIPSIQSKTGQSFSYSVILKLKDGIKNDN